MSATSDQTQTQHFWEDGTVDVQWFLKAVVAGAFKRRDMPQRVKPLDVYAVLNNMCKDAQNMPEHVRGEERSLLIDLLRSLLSGQYFNELDRQYCSLDSDMDARELLDGLIDAGRYTAETLRAGLLANAINTARPPVYGWSTQWAEAEGKIAIRNIQLSAYLLRDSIRMKLASPSTLKTY